MWSPSMGCNYGTFSRGVARLRLAYLPKRAQSESMAGVTQPVLPSLGGAGILPGRVGVW